MRFYILEKTLGVQLKTKVGTHKEQNKVNFLKLNCSNLGNNVYNRP